MIELLTVKEMAAADRRAMAGGIAGLTLMENAGRAVADGVPAQSGRRVVVVAGPGNNGGDGFVAARLLRERGFAVRVMLAGMPERLTGDAAAAAQRWGGAVEAADPGAIKQVDVIVDALFGAGLDRPVDGLPRALIGAMNGAGAPIVAVDLPSGINGDSGQAMGVAVKAATTVTFFRRKPGHLLMPGRWHCGALRVADIAIPDAALDAIKPRAFANEPGLWQAHFPAPQPMAHKYSRGHVVVVSGGLASTGAARLAARAALRAGAGVVTLASPREALAVNAAASLAVMVRPVDGAVELGEFLDDRRRNAVVIGPGGGVGADMRLKVQAALASEAAVVLDADALTSFAGDAAGLSAVIGAGRAAPVVATPHEGEFIRLFNKLYQKYKLNSKLEITRLAASQLGAIVLHKGPDTVVAAPDGRASVAANAPPLLATAGSGDVLAGIIAALLAQRMPAFEAASAAAWLHGEAANAFGPGLIAEDLLERIPDVLRALAAGRP